MTDGQSQGTTRRQLLKLAVIVTAILIPLSHHAGQLAPTKVSASAPVDTTKNPWVSAEVTSAEYVAPPASVAPPAPVYNPLPTNFYKNYIYAHESGNNPYSINSSSGACGLGQSLPCSKLTSVCVFGDYNCEDRWFDNYAVSRYGSWQNAYYFWIGHSWW